MLEPFSKAERVEIDIAVQVSWIGGVGESVGGGWARVVPKPMNKAG